MLTNADNQARAKREVEEASEKGERDSSREVVANSAMLCHREKAQARSQWQRNSGIVLQFVESKCRVKCRRRKEK